jgi:hypothetical protein
MLIKESNDRISVVGCLEHPWFTKAMKSCSGPNQAGFEHSVSHESHTKIIQRLKDFRAPQRLQMEALTFLVNNLGSAENQADGSP